VIYSQTIQTWKAKSPYTQKDNESFQMADSIHELLGKLQQLQAKYQDVDKET
jgi:hypothetical protein